MDISRQAVETFVAIGILGIGIVVEYFMERRIPLMYMLGAVMLLLAFLVMLNEWIRPMLLG